MLPAQFHLLCNTHQDALSNSTQSLKPSLSFPPVHETHHEQGELICPTNVLKVLSR